MKIRTRNICNTLAIPCIYIVALGWHATSYAQAPTELPAEIYTPTLRMDYTLALVSEPNLSKPNLDKPNAEANNAEIKRNNDKLRETNKVTEVSNQPSLKTTPTSIRMTYESLSLPAGEKMGMLGGDLLFNVSDNMRLGVGSYGAVRGERGGFITLGVEGEMQHRLSQNWLSHAGLFVGAGGGRGGYTLSGGGLMLRGDVGLTYETAGYGNLGFGVSHVRFPSGVITSTQPYINYELPFNTLLSPSWQDKPLNANNERVDPIQSGQNEFALVSRYYKIPSSAVRDNGQPQSSSLKLLGVEWLSYLDDRWFLKVESEGAMGGENTGYMQILLGGGYRLPLTRSTAIKLHTTVGPAGGGGADTGGGILLDTGIALQQNLTQHTALELSVSDVRAPSKSFEALSLGLKLNYQFGLPSVSNQAISWNALNDFDAQKMRVRVANQTYFKADPQWRGVFVDKPVSNLGVQMDYFISPNLFITGQGLAAYAGKAGAYMVGEVGLGTKWAITDNWFVESEALLGAAGGGGLRVGGGLVAQGNASIGYQITDSLSILATAGRMQAIKGDFKANVAGVSLAYQFTGFAAK
ncbi:MAG: hypothetical protein HOP06_02610 [Methylotenera sp.]|nr:hypothetical protein [Methylotenera sp.]